MRRNEDKHGREGGKENRKLKALILKQEMGQMWEEVVQGNGRDKLIEKIKHKDRNKTRGQKKSCKVGYEQTQFIRERVKD